MITSRVFSGSDFQTSTPLVIKATNTVDEARPAPMSLTMRQTLARPAFGVWSSLVMHRQVLGELVARIASQPGGELLLGCDGGAGFRATSALLTDWQRCDGLGAAHVAERDVGLKLRDDCAAEL